MEGEERRGREGEEREGGRGEGEGGGRGTIINNSLKWKRVESLVYFLQVHMVYIGKS